MIRVATVQALVAEANEVSVDAMRKPDGIGARNRPEAWARQEAFLLSRELTGHSLPRIGQLFGHRDHSTVHSGIRRARSRYATDAEVRRRIDSVSVRLLMGEGR